MARFDSNRSTSRSDSLLPSMRVEEPMLSMVATRRNADKRSGAIAPRARHAPLNSSILAIRPKTSGVIWRVSTLSINRSLNQKHTHLHPIAVRAAHCAAQTRNGHVDMIPGPGECPAKSTPCRKERNDTVGVLGGGLGAMVARAVDMDCGYRPRARNEGRVHQQRRL